ncbi:MULTISPECIES: hypothetical protein [unclassified Streptomyces]|uniref:hypothetical protein n=1 Tax=unclassified Streptomyces TaxID=2593676 RepID=UPI0036E06792
MTTSIELPAYVGGTKKSLIGGRWVRAASGERIDVINPATGASLGAIAARGRRRGRRGQGGAHCIRRRVVVVDAA